MPRPREFIRHFNLLVAEKADFSIYTGNSSCYIETERKRTFYADNKRSREFFTVFSKLKTHLMEKKFCVNVDANETEYYINHIHPDGVRKKTVWAVDISNAYPSVLLVDGLITAEIKSEMDSLPKTEKLSLIGMLAHRKNWLAYRNGRRYGNADKSELIPELGKFFFHCADRIHWLMVDALQNTDSFLFSWVDCAYFANLECAEKALSIFAEQGFNFTLKPYTNFCAEPLSGSHRVMYNNTKGDVIEMRLPRINFDTPGMAEVKAHIWKFNHSDMDLCKSLN